MGKRAQPHPFENNPFLEGFSEWMDSPQGELSMEVSDAVWELLDTASVDVGKRHIIWEDGEALDIDQSLDRIQKTHPDFPLPLIETHVLAWLEGGFVPEGYSGKAMEEFERKIDRWLKDHERQHRRRR